MNSCSPEAEKEALRVCDELFDTFYAHDAEGHIRTMNFPHVRLASGRVTVWETPDAVQATYFPLMSQLLEPGWHHTIMDQKGVIHSGPDKGHVAVQDTSWTADHQRIATHQAHWGVQVRSSFAP
jgi:hypothetical protein